MKYKYPKEYYKKSNRKYYLNNRKKIIAKTKKYHKIHPDKAKKNHKTNNRRYYLNNREKVIAKTLEWQKKNPEKFKIIIEKGMKKYRSTPKGIYRDMKQTSRVKKRGEILLQDEFIEWYIKQEKKCYYCGMDENLCKQVTGKRLTIDRKDNTKGYINGNLALACSHCNWVKGDILTEEEMKTVGKLIMEKRWKKK